jgi:uroporphyrinogen-III synthase
VKIKNILVSQPAPAVVEKSPFYELIKKYNLDIEFSPLFKVEGTSVADFRKQRVDVLAHTAVIFTSRATIDNFFRVCEQARITIPETMKYFCIGEAIALYLQKYTIYRKRKIFFGQGTITDLAELIVKHGSEKYILPLVEPHKVEIPKALDKLKIKYNKLIIAKTVSADLSTIDINKFDIAVCYSPSDIAVLSELKTKCEEIKPHIAIMGNGTAQAANAEGFKISVLAPTPEFPSITMALDSFIQKINTNKEVDEIKVEKTDNVASILKVVQPKTKKRKSTTKSSSSKSSSTKSTTAKTSKSTTTAKTTAAKKSTTKKSDETK